MIIFCCPPVGGPMANTMTLYIVTIFTKTLDTNKCDWVLESWPNLSISLAQLIATLIHYLCTVALTVLADWSAFLKLALPTIWSHNWDNSALQDGRYGSDIHPCVSETSKTSTYVPNSPIGMYNLLLTAHLPPPPTPPFPPAPLIRIIQLLYYLHICNCLMM